MSPSSWSLLSLTDLVAAFGDPDNKVDIDGALFRVAETLNAEIAVLCDDTSVLHCHGFGIGDRPDDLLIRLSHASATEAELPSLGRVSIVTGNHEHQSQRLLLARTSGLFTADEIAFVRGLGRVVSLAAAMRSALEAERHSRAALETRMADNKRLVRQLRERQGLLDRLFRIQQSISHRDAIQDVLDSIVNGAVDLLGVEQASIRLSDLERHGTLVLVSSAGVPSEIVERFRDVEIGEQIPAEVITEGTLVVRYEKEDAGTGSLMSAPVVVENKVVGCLTVGDGSSRRYSSAEQEALLAFAQHASLALQDARASDAMRNALDRERRRAEHDPLTGLPNRATVRAALAHRVAVSERIPISVLFVDLDRFKLANDTLGHAFGDRVLTAVGDRLRLAVRGSDVVGRLSGDEFIMVVEGITEVGAVEFAARIQDAISEPITDGQVEHVITASIGIARVHRTDTAEEVLSNADLAMYRAKQLGRGRIEVFDRAMRERIEHRVSVSQELRRALANDEFTVYLQPLVELPTRRVCAFEALVRWNHPTRGVVVPGDFIPLAEETGLVSRIDHTVMRKAIKMLADHPKARPVAMNLSARTFSDPNIVTVITDLLAEHSVDASRLVIEVTETVLMDQTGTAARHVQSLRDLGLAVMIDDFGTGYSSLSYLQSFDVDGVKIDRTFIARLGEDTRADAIVAAVFHMAEALGLVVVAEGIETDQQVARLLEIRERTGQVAIHGQGYLFGRPAEGNTRLAGFVEVALTAQVG